ncbi:hypothetical protein GQ600_5228 [Phytophthora cactorum]|nr:hypothetical protein GQ600_5228 [Phytophthora cactorum]
MFKQSETVKHFSLALEDLGTTTFLQMLKLLVSDVIESLTSSTSENDEISKKRKIRQATEAGRRRVYRRIQKHEREELRRQTRALNEELSRVRQLQEKEEATFDAAQTPTFWLWKSVATRQRRVRLLAEDEHRALTITAQLQATYIRSLCGIVRKREDDSFA